MKDINNFEKIQTFTKRGRRSKYANCLIKVIDKDGNVAYGSDTVIVAKALGCTKQLISQCIRRPNQFKSARGCKIILVDSVTLEPVEG